MATASSKIWTKIYATYVLRKTNKPLPSSSSYPSVVGFFVIVAMSSVLSTFLPQHNQQLQQQLPTTTAVTAFSFVNIAKYLSSPSSSFKFQDYILSPAMPATRKPTRRGKINNRGRPRRDIVGTRTPARKMNIHSSYDWEETITAVASSSTSTAMAKQSEKKIDSSCSSESYGIQNFRPVAGTPLGTIYRCASTDTLGERLLTLKQLPLKYDDNYNGEPSTESSSSKSSESFLLQAHPEWTAADRFVLEDAGLILDLRSDVERNNTEAQTWIDFVNSNNDRHNDINDNEEDSTTTPTTAKCTVPATETERLLSVRSISSDDIALASNDINDDHFFPPFRRTDLSTGKYCPSRPRPRRHVVQVDVLNPRRFMSYVDAAWLSPFEVSWYKLVSGTKLHNARIKALNERGLAGLNEAILESGRQYLCWSLKAITVYREKALSSQSCSSQCDKSTDIKRDKIVIHCVQGKDRTGMLSMLVQLILGVSDEVIIDDYYKSNEGLGLLSLNDDPACTKPRTRQSSSAAAAVAKTKSQREGTTQEGKLDRNIFSGTTREAMVTTLEYIRSKYVSFDLYLDEIGFDVRWRQRLRSSLLGEPSTLGRSRI